MQFVPGGLEGLVSTPGTFNWLLPMSLDVSFNHNVGPARYICIVHRCNFLVA